MGKYNQKNIQKYLRKNAQNLEESYRVSYRENVLWDIYVLCG